jgi:hypothetical protein
MQKDNTPMWIAITILGGLGAYLVLRKDVVAVTDKVTDGAVYVADKANPLSQTNVVNSAITEVGKAITMRDSWSLGTQIYDWAHPEESTTSAPVKAANYKAKVATTPTSKKVEAGLPAKQFNGKWLKLAAGKWIGLTKSDKVFSVSGRYVVHHYLWKPS